MLHQSLKSELSSVGKAISRETLQLNQAEEYKAEEYQQMIFPDTTKVSPGERKDLLLLQTLRELRGEGYHEDHKEQNTDREKTNYKQRRDSQKLGSTLAPYLGYSTRLENSCSSKNTAIVHKDALIHKAQVKLIKEIDGQREQSLRMQVKHRVNSAQGRKSQRRYSSKNYLAVKQAELDRLTNKHGCMNINQVLKENEEHKERILSRTNTLKLRRTHTSESLRREISIKDREQVIHRTNTIKAREIQKFKQSMSLLKRKNMCMNPDRNFIKSPPSRLSTQTLSLIPQSPKEPTPSAIQKINVDLEKVVVPIPSSSPIPIAKSPTAKSAIMSPPTNVQIPPSPKPTPLPSAKPMHSEVVNTDDKCVGDCADTEGSILQPDGQEVIVYRTLDNTTDTRVHSRHTKAVGKALFFKSQPLAFGRTTQCFKGNKIIKSKPKMAENRRSDYKISRSSTKLTNHLKLSRNIRTSLDSFKSEYLARTLFSGSKLREPHKGTEEGILYKKGVAYNLDGIAGLNLQVNSHVRNSSKETPAGIDSKYSVEELPMASSITLPRRSESRNSALQRHKTSASKSKGRNLVSGGGFRNLKSNPKNYKLAVTKKSNNASRVSVEEAKQFLTNFRHSISCENKYEIDQILQSQPQAYTYRQISVDRNPTSALDDGEEFDWRKSLIGQEASDETQKNELMKTITLMPNKLEFDYR